MTDSRGKGKRGEREARHLLIERGWDVTDTSDGIGVCDFIAFDASGKAFSVEVKNTRAIDLPRFVRQAKGQAGKRPWLLMAHLHGYTAWLVAGSGIYPTVWRSK